MEQEIRIIDGKDINEILAKEADVLSFGHEGCIKRLPEVELVSKIATKRKVKLVLPKLRDADMEPVNRYLQKVMQCAQETIEVTVNDFGALHHFSKKENIELVAGRLLTKGFEAHPQAEHVCKRYPVSWKQNVMQSCMVDEGKIQLFKSYGVKAVEVDILKYTANAIEYLAERLSVHGRMDNSLLAVFPICPYKKNICAEEVQCWNLCKQNVYVEYSDEVGVKQGGDPLELSGYLDGNVFTRKNHELESEYVTRNIRSML